MHCKVKPKKFKKTLPLVEYNTVGNNTEALNISPDSGRGMLLFIKKDIKYTLIYISLFTEVVTNSDNSLIIACVYRSPNSTADNTNTALAERYYSKLVV